MYDLQDFAREKHTGKVHQSVEPRLPKVATLISGTCATNAMRRRGDGIMLSNIDYSVADRKRKKKSLAVLVWSLQLGVINSLT